MVRADTRFHVCGGNVPPVAVDLSPGRKDHLARPRTTGEQQQFQRAGRRPRALAQVGKEDGQLPPWHGRSGPHGHCHAGQDPQGIIAGVGPAEPARIDRHGVLEIGLALVWRTWSALILMALVGAT